MPKGIYNRRRKAHNKANGQDTTALVPVADISKPVNMDKMVPMSEFEKLPWWNKLDETERVVVADEGQGLAKAMYYGGISRVAIGARLFNLRQVLMPKGLFDKFLRGFHFNKRTAYRYVAGFENAQKFFTEHNATKILDAAYARGINIIGENPQRPLGIYTDAVKKLPPPENPTNSQAVTYLEQLEDVRRKNRGKAITKGRKESENEPTNPNILLKECYRFFHVRFGKLKGVHHKTKATFVKTLMGMMAMELGVSNPMTVEPQAVPDDFKVQRGRPRTVTAEEPAAQEAAAA